MKKKVLALAILAITLVLAIAIVIVIGINLRKSQIPNEEDFILADVATGSGCIALAMKETFKGSTVLASDISESAIEVAKKNFKGKNIEVLQGNLLDPFIEKGIRLDVLMCNPPYIGDIKVSIC